MNSSTLPDGYTIVQLDGRFYPMRYAFTREGTPMLTPCYWHNGLVASYVRRTLAVIYLRELTQELTAPVPPVPAPSKYQRKKKR